VVLLPLKVEEVSLDMGVTSLYLQGQAMAQVVVFLFPPGLLRTIADPWRSVQGQQITVKVEAVLRWPRE
jgi:hypothetical protein